MSDDFFGGVVSDNPTQSFGFGLNQGAKLTKFEHNPNIEFNGSDNTADGIEIEIEVGGIKFSNIIYKPSKTDRSGNAKDADIFKKELDAAKQKIYHIAKCFADEIDIANAVAGKRMNFGAYVSAIKDTFEEGWQEKALDVFFQYQWQLRDGAEKKYLELPKHTRQGFFLIPTIAGDFQEVLINKEEGAEEGVATVKGVEIGTVSKNKLTTKSGNEFKLPSSKTALCYIDVAQDKIHPFARTKWFMTNGWGMADDGADENLDSWDD